MTVKNKRHRSDDYMNVVDFIQYLYVLCKYKNNYNITDVVNEVIHKSRVVIFENEYILTADEVEEFKNKCDNNWLV